MIVGRSVRRVELTADPAELREFILDQQQQSDQTIHAIARRADVSFTVFSSLRRGWQKSMGFDTAIRLLGALGWRVVLERIDGD